jgi:Adenosylmethionine-8-amino-7-oxononanoate aminotransferase
MAKHQVIGDVRGKGLFCGAELVSDRRPRHRIWPPDHWYKKVAFENGAMLRVSGNNILLSPPLIVTEAEVNDIANAIEAGLIRRPRLSRRTLTIKNGQYLGTARLHPYSDYWLKD